MLTHLWYPHLSASTVIMKRLSIVITIAVLLLACSAGESRTGNSATAVVEFSVEEISAMEVSGALAHPVMLTSPATGESEFDGSGDTYIRYTSVVPEGKTRSISAAITSGTVPCGCRLKMNVVELTGNGTFGSAVPGGIYLTDSPQGIVSGIGNCCTGINAGDGVRIEYALEVKDASKLVADEASAVTVLFTIN